MSCCFCQSKLTRSLVCTRSVSWVLAAWYGAGLAAHSGTVLPFLPFVLWLEVVLPEPEVCSVVLQPKSIPFAAAKLITAKALKFISKSLNLPQFGKFLLESRNFKL